MIDKLVHQVDARCNGVTVSCPCDSESALVVALVPATAGHREHLSVTQRSGGYAMLLGVYWHPDGAGLARAQHACGELLAMPVDWSSDADIARAFADPAFAREYVDIRVSAKTWVVDSAFARLVAP